jgi:hypothetical protein
MRKLALTGSPLASWIQKMTDSGTPSTTDPTTMPMAPSVADVPKSAASSDRRQRQQIQASALALSCACSLSLMVVFPLAIVETCLST